MPLHWMSLLSLIFHCIVWVIIWFSRLNLGMHLPREETFGEKNDDIYMWNIWDLSWSSTCEESGKQISPLWLCLRHHLKSVCFHMKSCVNSCGSIWLSEPVCICHVHQADGEGLEEGDSRRVCLTLKPEAKESSLFGNTFILATLWWLRVCVLPGGNLATSPQRCLEE